MLDNLTPQQVEQALAWLHSPVKEPPPQSLKHLNELEWFLLQRMLDHLLLDRGQTGGVRGRIG